VLREIEQHVGPDTIIATNTSSLPLEDLASALSNPKRFVALHFFNPVPRMPLVEVVPARKTSSSTTATALELMRRLGKTAALVGDCPGFLVNRILLPYLVEAAWMVEQGVAPRRIDRALESFGMPMGPLTLADEVGLDVGGKVALVLADAYGARMRVPALLSEAVASGELKGRKNGEGFYRYDGRKRKPNPRISALAESARHRDGVPRLDKLAAEEIRDRTILIMVNEAARCLSEGIAANAEALDLAMVMGTGFAPFRGGLLRYADERGLHEVKQRLDELSLSCGDRFRPASLLVKLAREGGRFHEDGRVPDGRHEEVRRSRESAALRANGEGRKSDSGVRSRMEGVR
jgi:3-hydroxyacyl-CoA dehydrogenase/enoyl-CoA hydratase/3-hydroxybutyryl-CoA epimerase